MSIDASDLRDTCAVTISAALVLLVICSTPTQAKYSSACDSSTGMSAQFFGFKQLVIHYANFPRSSEQKGPTYPTALKFDEFNQRVMAAIENNFASCLSQEGGERKPLVVIAPESMRPSEKEAREKWVESLQQLTDHNNLIVTVALTYEPQIAAELGADETAVFSWYITRPGYPSAPLYRMYYGVDVLSPTNSRAFQAQLERMATGILPVGKYIADPLRDNE